MMQRVFAWLLPIRPIVRDYRVEPWTRADGLAAVRQGRAHGYVLSTALANMADAYLRELFA